jgi:hypothetical protein
VAQHLFGRYPLDHHAELLAATPAELKPDIELELRWYEAIAAANGDANAATAPPGFVEAAQRISVYQTDRCGISYSYKGFQRRAEAWSGVSPGGFGPPMAPR